MTVPETTAKAADETPLFLPSGSEHISAIYSRPVSAATGVGVLILHSGYMTMSSHRNRMWTRLARRLAGRGCHVLRLDFHGSGDSSGTLSDRADAQSLSDVIAGVELLRRAGARRLVLVGNCYGAYMAVVAARQVEDLAALALVAPPPETFAAPTPRQRRSAVVRALHVAGQPSVWRLAATDAGYRRWLMARVRRRVTGSAGPGYRYAAVPAERVIDVPREPGELLRHVADRGVEVHVVWGQQDAAFQEVSRAHDFVLETFRQRLDVRIVPGQVHGFPTGAVQDLTIDLVTTWVQECE